MIEAIVWDYGQVVFFFPNEGWLRPWSRVDRISKALAALDERRVQETLLAAQCRFETGQATENQHRLAVSAAFGIDPPLSWREFKRGYLMSERLELNAPLIAAQAAIAKAGMPQAAISNLCPIWHRVLWAAGATAHMDFELCSYAEGELKPSEELAVRAVDRLGAAAENVLFVDDLQDNLTAAEQIGARTHRFRGNGELAALLLELGLPSGYSVPLTSGKPTSLRPHWRSP